MKKTARLKGLNEDNYNENWWDELKEFWSRKRDCLSDGYGMWEKMQSKDKDFWFQLQQAENLEVITCVLATRRKPNSLKINNFCKGLWANLRNKATEQTTTPGKCRDAQMNSIYLEQKPLKP